MGRLDNRVCMITGAARGIGRGIAARLAAEGAAVCIADVDSTAADAVASEISEADARAIAIDCDVGERKSVQSAIRATVDAFGRVDVLFNNAGISKTQYFLEITEEDWERIMRVNGLGVLLCMQEAAEQMRRQGDGGKIVNTASIAGKEGFPLFGAYCASKFAVIGLTHAGARALAGDGITVNAFCPGVVATELWDQLDREFMEIGETERPGQSLEEFGAGILAGRPSTPDDIAGLAVFLASPESDYITGQAINVDGGMLFH
jgi:meso-butanediol dehydrogenase / (S,S)-butanediol dehydrogenase / diacetyl reductase